MKLHFCEGIKIENVKEIERERIKRQQDCIVIFESKFLKSKRDWSNNANVFDLKEIIL